MSDIYKLPDVSCPIIFNIAGGTRVFLVRAGPGERSSKERTDGKCNLSFKSDDKPNHRTDEVQSKVALELEGIISRVNNFKGATIDTLPTIFHDGQPKSVHSYNVFRSVAAMPHNDGMKDAPDEVTADYFWNYGMNRTDVKTLTSIIVFAGTKTIYSVLAAANSYSRIIVGAGAIVPVMFPINGMPSVAIGMGEFAPNAMRWGIVTEEESLTEDESLTEKSLPVAKRSRD